MKPIASSSNTPQVSTRPPASRFEQGETPQQFSAKALSDLARGSAAEALQLLETQATGLTESEAQTRLKRSGLPLGF